MMTRKVMIKGLFWKLKSMRTLLLVGLINQYPQLCLDNKGGWFKPRHDVIRREMQVKEPVYWAALRSLRDLGLISEGRHAKDGKMLRIEFAAISVYLRGWQWQAWMVTMGMAFRNTFTWNHRPPKKA